jgi:acyl dehydratase
VTGRTRRDREFELTADLQRAYSRSGNFHADPEEAEKLGLPGLVAQGMQVVGPAYGELLDVWGDDLLEHGEVDLKFVGMVLAGDTVDAVVDLDADTATIEVTRRENGATAAVGTARRRA